MYVVTAKDKAKIIETIVSTDAPFTITIVEGKKRSESQNRLMWKLCEEISQQTGDRTVIEVQAFNKLHYGVPILRAEDEYFRERYDQFIKPHSYEDKLKLMEGDMFPVTRLMTTKQKTKFLDEVYRNWSMQGIILTVPQDEGLTVTSN